MLLRDLEVGFDHLHGADAAEAHDDLGIHQLQLLLQIRGAGFLLRVQRVTVLRRAALDGVGDVDAVAAETDHGQHVVQQLTCLAHKGFAQRILPLAGSFAHEQNLGVGIAHAEHHVGAALAQAAAAAVQTLLL